MAAPAPLRINSTVSSESKLPTEECLLLSKAYLPLIDMIYAVPGDHILL